MTEEQRYRERIALEKDKITLLKRIADALDRAYPPISVLVANEDEIERCKMMLNAIPPKVSSED